MRRASPTPICDAHHVTVAFARCRLVYRGCRSNDVAAAYRYLLSSYPCRGERHSLTLWSFLVLQLTEPQRCCPPRIAPGASAANHVAPPTTHRNSTSHPPRIWPETSTHQTSRSRCQISHPSLRWASCTSSTGSACSLALSTATQSRPFSPSGTRGRDLSRRGRCLVPACRPPPLPCLCDSSQVGRLPFCPIHPPSWLLFSGSRQPCSPSHALLLLYISDHAPPTDHVHSGASQFLSS